MCDWIVLFSEFQTGIVGVIGFGGVILSQQLNARHARKQSQRDFERRQLSMVGALLAELRMHRRNFKDTDAEDCLIDGHLIAMPRISRLVSNSFTSEIGILPLGTQEAVLQALFTIDNADRALSKFAKSIDENHFIFDKDSIENCRMVLDRSVRPLDDAISILEHELR